MLKGISHPMCKLWHICFECHLPCFELETNSKKSNLKYSNLAKTKPKIVFHCNNMTQNNGIFHMKSVNQSVRQ